MAMAPTHYLHMHEIALRSHEYASTFVRRNGAGSLKAPAHTDMRFHRPQPYQRGRASRNMTIETSNMHVLSLSPSLPRAGEGPSCPQPLYNEDGPFARRTGYRMKCDNAFPAGAQCAGMRCVSRWRRAVSARPGLR